MSRRTPLALSIVTVLVAGCGSATTAATTTPPSTPSANAPAPGTVVAPHSAREVIARSGFRIHWRKGSVPKPYVAALYGTAQGRYDATINFGFFFTGNTRGEALDRRPLRKLVPHSTQEGSTAGVSFVVITSAGSSKLPPYGKHVNEEFRIFDLLDIKVGKLAPVAHENESP
jgi:hypothetical protein